MNAEDIVKTHAHIILFDGLCNLCSGWVHFVYRRDPQARFHFVSVQSTTGKALLQWAGLSTLQIDTMVYIEQGQAYTKSTAFLRAIRHFPRAWPLLSAGRVIPLPVRDFLYDRVAQNRYRLFGQRQTCMVPGSDLSLRFL